MAAGRTGTGTRLAALLEGARPLNALLVAPAVALGALLAGGREALFAASTGLAVLATALSLGAGNLWNDLADRVEDAVNAPDRPLPSGRLTPAWAWTGALAGAGLALLAGRAIGPGALRVVLACLAALAWYARRGKGVPLAGNALVAALAGVAVLFGAGVAGDWRAAAVPALLAAVVHFEREAVKDLADAEGDSLAGRRSWAAGLGAVRLSAWLRRLSFALPVTALLAAVLELGFDAALVAHGLVAGPLAIWNFRLLRAARLADPAACRRTATRLKGLLAVGLLVYLVAGWLAG